MSTSPLTRDDATKAINVFVSEHKAESAEKEKHSQTLDMDFLIRNVWNQSRRLIPRVPPPNPRRDLLKQVFLGAILTTYTSKRVTH